MGKSAEVSAFITGIVISVMVVFNTKLGEATTNSVSILVNQIVGIVFLTAVMLAFRKNAAVNPERRKAPWYLWFGGLFGLLVISCNYFSVTGAGTTIAMAGAVFGQCLAGLVFDLTGWMGMEKRGADRRRIISIMMSALGIFVMIAFAGERIAPSYAALAAAAGVITMVQMVYNSRLASYKGAFFAARQNVISGLAGITLFAFAARPEATAEALSVLPSLPFLTIAGGGVLACFVVVMSNTIIPRIPGAVSSVLMSAGQVLAAALLDRIIYDRFYPSLVAGSVIMLLGLAVTRRSR